MDGCRYCGDWLCFAAQSQSVKNENDITGYSILLVLHRKMCVIVQRILQNAMAVQTNEIAHFSTINQSLVIPFCGRYHHGQHGVFPHLATLPFLKIIPQT